MNTTLLSYALWRKDVSIKDIPYNDVDYLILVGGSTLSPIIREHIKKSFNIPLFFYSICGKMNVLSSHGKISMALYVIFRPCKNKVTGGFGIENIRSRKHQKRGNCRSHR